MLLLGNVLAFEPGELVEDGGDLGVDPVREDVVESVEDLLLGVVVHALVVAEHVDEIGEGFVSMAQFRCDLQKD